MGFSKLGLSKPLLTALEKKGFSDPTPIQKRSIPVILDGKDIVGLAKTGTGKTIAFSLPILEILCLNSRSGKFRPIRLLVLSPTRELAAQIESVISEFASVLNLKSLPIFGGVPFFKQVRALRRGSDILVCTPGRLEDHLSQKTIDLSRVTHLVIDEADQMLDIGFLPSIKRLIEHLPRERQTLLFSATMPQAVKDLSKNYLKAPAEVYIPSVSMTVDKIQQNVIFLLASEKLSVLKHLIQSKPKKRILVFSRTKYGADKVAQSLKKNGLSLDVIHGNKSQLQRQKALTNFKSGYRFVLIATDIAARGIDVQNIELVVNYDLPDVPETYLHRIGRTARAGSIGQAISLCSGSDKKKLRAIERFVKTRIIRLNLNTPDILNSLGVNYENPEKITQEIYKEIALDSMNSRRKTELGKVSKHRRRGRYKKKTQSSQVTQ